MKINNEMLNQALAKTIEQYIKENDLEKVRHGKWIKLNKSYNITEVYKCSLCGRHLYMDKNTPKKFILKIAPYCHCGAKMDGKDERR